MTKIGQTESKNALSQAKMTYAFTAVTIVLSLTFMVYTLPAPFLPLYHMQRNVSSIWDGVILGVVPVGSVGATLCAGVLLNHVSNKPVLIGASATLGIFFIINSWFNKIVNNTVYVAVSCIFRIFCGVSTGTVAVTSFAILTKLVPTRVAFVTALAEAALNGAQAFGPFLGSILWEVGGYSMAFWVPGVMILACILLVLSVPYVNTTPDLTATNDSAKVYKDPWILLAAWHCAACQVLLYFHLPILAPFAERALDETVFWTGLALLVNTSTIIISAPPLGWLIDKFNPYFFVMFSAVILPFLYMFLGPLPLFHVATSQLQVMLVLAFLGLFVPMGCTPILLIMFDVYKLRNKGELSISASNTIVSIYCSCFPLGACIGSFAAGVSSLFCSFEWATGGFGLIFLIQTILAFIYCWRVRILKHSYLNDEKKPLLGVYSRDAKPTVLL